MNRKELPFYVMVISISLLLQGIAMFFLYSHVNWYLVPLDKPFQVFVLVSFAAALTPVYIAGSIYARICIFALKTGACLFATQALGMAGNVYYCLLMSMMSEIPAILPGFWGLVCAPAVLIAVLDALRAHTAEHIYIEGITFSGQILLFLCGICVSGTISMLKYYLHKSIRLQREVSRLTSVIDHITDTNLAYQQYAAVLERTTIEKERQRISREIHDIIGYTMTNVLMLIQAAQSSRSEMQIRMLLDKAQKHLNESVEDARLSLRRLRDREIPPERGRVLFSRLTRTFSDITGIKIRMDFGNLPEKLNGTVERIIFRMLEESMTNAFKHGTADLITIYFLYENGDIIIRIFDNGTRNGQNGTEVKEGIGLRGMRERIEPLGGTLTAQFVADGFLLRAVIPEGNPDE